MTTMTLPHHPGVQCASVRFAQPCHQRFIFYTDICCITKRQLSVPRATFSNKRPSDVEADKAPNRDELEAGPADAMDDDDANPKNPNIVEKLVYFVRTSLASFMRLVVALVSPIGKISNPSGIGRFVLLFFSFVLVQVRLNRIICNVIHRMLCHESTCTGCS